MTNEDKNENKNNITNTIIINRDETKLSPLTPRSSISRPSSPKVTSPYNSLMIDTSPEHIETFAPDIERQSTPECIKAFKDYLLLTLIHYFKNDIILFNNLIELSKYIVLKLDDLRKLIAILLTDGDINRIMVESELPKTFNCCPCADKLPIYNKISSIIIDKKKDFKVKYNEVYTQMQLEFNISLDFVLR
jgi:hypothetical protein